MFDNHGRKRITLESMIEVIIDGRRISTGHLESGKVYNKEDLFSLPDAIPMKAIAVGDSPLLEKFVHDENIQSFEYMVTNAGKKTGIGKRPWAIKACFFYL